MAKKPQKGWAALLTSVRVAVVIFVLLTVACVIATLLPQGMEAGYYEEIYGSFLAGLITLAGFDQMFSSPIFILLAVIFGVNLFSCTLLRLNRALRLRQAAAWGSPLLHLGLCLVLVGVVVSLALGETGFYTITQGEKAEITQGDPSFELRLEEFSIDFYEDGLTPRQYSSTLTAIGPQGEETALYSEVNQPAVFAGTKIFQMSYGWQLKVTLGDGEGNDHPLTIADSGVLPLSEVISLQVEFLPDATVDTDGLITENSRQPLNPHLLATLTMGGQVAGVKPVALGQRAEIMPGVELAFDDYAYYSGLQVKRDAGVPVIFIGFILILAGMALRFLAPKKKPPGRDPEPKEPGEERETEAGQGDQTASGAPVDPVDIEQPIDNGYIEDDEPPAGDEPPTEIASQKGE